MADLDAEDVPETQRNGEAGQTTHQRQQVIFLAGADHAFEELAAVENADPVEEHDQAGQADRAGDRGLRRKRPERESDEQHRADAERKPADVDLPDQVAEPDGEKDCKDRLCSDDITREVDHGGAPVARAAGRDQRARHPAASNCSRTRLTSSGEGGAVSASFSSRPSDFHLKAPI